MKTVIQIDGLTKSYSNKTVLKGLTFSVAEGEILALLGVNGAGKTTALECVEGLRKYDSGNVVVNGKMGIQLQSSSLPDHIRPMEAVTLFSKWNKVKIDNAMLVVLGINEMAKKQYKDLSTGQKRRLHLALALLSDPDIVFLDEPTAGLDVEGRVSLHQQIRKLKEMGKTIVLASHDMAEVETLCDRIAILKDGNIAFLGSIDELNEKTRKLFSIVIKTDKGNLSLESDNVGDVLLDSLQKFKNEGIKVLDVKVDRGTLEQYFVSVTGGNEE